MKIRTFFWSGVIVIITMVGLIGCTENIQTKVMPNDIPAATLAKPEVTLAPDEMVLRVDLPYPVPVSFFSPGQRVGLIGVVETDTDIYAKHLTDAGRLLWIMPIESATQEAQPIAAIIALPDNSETSLPTPYDKVLSWAEQEGASFTLLLVPDSAPNSLPEPNTTGFSMREFLAPIERIEDEMRQNLSPFTG